MKIPFVAVLTLCSFLCYCQDYIRSNEQLILSFTTRTQKQVYLVKDTSNKYIVYRFGTKDKIEFEYPVIHKDSWSKFTYSFYLRGGGRANEGMDLNYIYFNHNGFRYVIYDTYYAVENRSAIGIKVTNQNTKKTKDIKADSRSRKGTLIDFRDNGLLEIGDELFD